MGIWALSMGPGWGGGLCGSSSKEGSLGEGEGRDQEELPLLFWLVPVAKPWVL